MTKHWNQNPQEPDQWVPHFGGLPNQKQNFKHTYHLCRELTNQAPRLSTVATSKDQARNCEAHLDTPTPRKTILYMGHLDVGMPCGLTLKQGQKVFNPSRQSTGIAGKVFEFHQFFPQWLMDHLSNEISFHTFSTWMCNPSKLLIARTDSCYYSLGCACKSVQICFSFRDDPLQIESIQLLW